MVVRRGFAAVVIIGTAYWTVATWIRDEYLTAAITAGFFLAAIGFSTTFALAQAGWVRPHVVFDETGTTLTEDRRLRRMLLVPCIVMIPTGILFFVFAFRHELELPLSGTELNGQMLIVVFVALLGSLVTALVTIIKAPTQVTLTSTGYHVVVRAGKHSGGAWADVLEVTPRQLIGNLEMSLPQTSGVVGAIDNSERYTPKGVAFYWMVRFYWRNPAMRQELSNGKALERLAEERFPTD